MNKTSTIPTLAALAALALTITSAQAYISLVDTDSAVTASDSAPGDFTLTAEGAGTRDGIYSYSYNAGASFDTLVVSVSRERNGGATGVFSVTYDGVAMTLATGDNTGSGASIYYLATTASSGTIALDFTGDSSTTNGIGIGIAAIESDNGDPIALIDADFGTGTSITIDPTVDDSFTMFAIDTNAGAFSGLGTAPLTEIYANDDVGSNGAGAAYDTDVDAGEITYSYTNTANPRGIAAANFAGGTSDPRDFSLVDTDSAVTGTGYEPNDFSYVAGGTGVRNGTYSYGYDAGASFDMLVVSVAREAGADVVLSVTYDGVSMDLATGPENSSGASIYYLATSAQSGTIAASFIGTGTFNGCGIGIAAIKSDNGDPIGLIDADSGTSSPSGPTSITINPTVAGSFTMFAIENNQSGTSVFNAPLTQIYANTDTGSTGSGASYDMPVAAGSVTYSYTAADPTKARSVAAANFAVSAADPKITDVRHLGATVELDLEGLDSAKTYKLYRDTTLPLSGSKVQIGADIISTATATVTDPGPLPVKAFYQAEEQP